MREANSYYRNRLTHRTHYATEPAMSSIKYSCPCGAALRVPQTALGKPFTCPKCGVRTVIAVNAPTDGLADAPAPPPDSATMIEAEPEPAPAVGSAPRHRPVRPDLFAGLIITTGDLASPAWSNFISRTPRPLIEKPFDLAVLAQLIEAVARGR